MVIKIIKEGSSIFKKFTCPTCNSGCGLLIEVKNNKVISINNKVISTLVATSSTLNSRSKWFKIFKK